MPRPSPRPVSLRTSSRSVGKAASAKKSPKEISLPEDDDDFRPRSRGKKRSKEQTKERDAKTREKFEGELEEMAGELLEAMEEEGDSSKSKISVFAKDFQKLRKTLSPENTELRIDEAASAGYRALLAMCFDLVGQAEKSYRQTGKEGSMYALQALVNQIRDLNNDVKLSEDIQGRLMTVEQLIRNAFIRMASFVLNEKYSMQRQIDALTTDGRLRKAFRKELDDGIKVIAHGMRDHQKLLNSQLALYLAGDPNYLNPQLGDAEENPDAPKKKKKRRTK